MNKLPDHLFVATTDGGNLYDTRKPQWPSFPPVRRNYSRHYSRIETLTELKSTIRASGFAWPGGYPLYFVTHDGKALCFDCARTQFRQIVRDFLHRSNTGWRVIACDVNYEDRECFCCHCNRQIKPAYTD